MKISEFKTRYISNEKGVTLMEVLIVLAIIAMLAALVGPRVIGYLGKAKSQVAQTQIGNLASSLELYFIENGSYPSEAEGLTALIEAPVGAINWDGPYIKAASALSDPWQRDYQYELLTDNDDFKITSYGRDGTEGGTGEDKDLFN